MRGYLHYIWNRFSTLFYEIVNPSHYERYHTRTCYYTIGEENRPKCLCKITASEPEKDARTAHQHTHANAVANQQKTSDET